VTRHPAPHAYHPTPREDVPSMFIDLPCLCLQRNFSLFFSLYPTLQVLLWAAPGKADQCAVPRGAQLLLRFRPGVMLAFDSCSIDPGVQTLTNPLHCPG